METDKIKEIVNQLTSEFRVFIHKTTEQIISVPDEDYYHEADFEHWDVKFKDIENNLSDYYEIEKWTSSEAFEAMSEFADQVPDFKLKSRLYDALSKRKPFSNFKFVIDHSGGYRQQWFDFIDQWQQDYVEKQINLRFLDDE